METAVTFTCVKCGETASRVGQLKPTVCDDCQSANKRALDKKRHKTSIPPLIEPEPGIRQCLACGENKPHSEYAEDRGRLRRNCKPCGLIKKAQLRAANGRSGEYEKRKAKRSTSEAAIQRLKDSRRKRAYARIDAKFEAKAKAKAKAKANAARQERETKPWLADGLTTAEQWAARQEWLRQNNVSLLLWQALLRRARRSYSRAGEKLDAPAKSVEAALPMLRADYLLAIEAAAKEQHPLRDALELAIGFKRNLSECGGATDDGLRSLLSLDNLDIVSNHVDDKPWLGLGLPNGYHQDKARAQHDAEFAILYKLRQRMAKKDRKRDKGKAGAVSKAVRLGVKGKSPQRATFTWLGYTPVDLRDHLELLFIPGMTWDAVMDDRIHIDHVRPLASYDLDEDDQLRAAWSLANLQPLWAEDNIKKGAKWSPPANDNEVMSVAA